MKDQVCLVSEDSYYVLWLVLCLGVCSCLLLPGCIRDEYLVISSIAVQVNCPVYVCCLAQNRLSICLVSFGVAKSRLRFVSCAYFRQV